VVDDEADVEVLFRQQFGATSALAALRWISPNLHQSRSSASRMRRGYVNLKAYWEFAAENRASGWNAWLTLSLSPKAPTTMGTSPILNK
jgi:hypothetical protein